MLPARRTICAHMADLSGVKPRRWLFGSGYILLSCSLLKAWRPPKVGANMEFKFLWKKDKERTK